jgi:hypothetical protein
VHVFDGMGRNGALTAPRVNCRPINTKAWMATHNAGLRSQRIRLICLSASVINERFERLEISGTRNQCGADDKARRSR